MTKRQLPQFLVRTPFSSFKWRKAKKLLPPTLHTDQSPPSLSAEIPPAEQLTVKPSSPLWGWSLVWLIIMVMLGGTGIIGALLLTMIPPPPDCQNISLLAADSERLYCAQIAAQSGKLDQLVTAMKVIESWRENHPLYLEAQRKMKEWSETILAIARQKLDQGDLKGAVNAVGKIPTNSPLYRDSQAKITNWQEEWQRSEEIVRQFQNALKIQNWSLASAQGQFLSKVNIEYWRSSRLDELMKQLVVEQTAWAQLQQARELAKLNTPPELEQAITLAAKVTPHSYVSATAQSERKQWSRSLLDIAAAQFAAENFTEAISVAKRVPGDLDLAQEAHDWIQLSLGQAASQQDHIFALTEALASVRQINSQSPLYKQAQTRISLWEANRRDDFIFQFAKTVATLDQPQALQVAINKLQLIGSNRPKYAQAQALIAGWRQKIQEISDRIALETAQKLAKPGTIDNLKASVAQASQIQPGQPLRSSAQTAIAQWTRQIQIIEDQPLLDLARSFAQKGDLISAMQSAQQIRPGRALYPDARAAINDWVAQIQIAEDRPILQTASSLADQGNLLAAIQIARQIIPGRPLYEQAQNSIALWQSKLTPVLPVIPSINNTTKANIQQIETSIRDNQITEESIKKYRRKSRKQETETSSQETENNQETSRKRTKNKIKSQDTEDNNSKTNDTISDNQPRRKRSRRRDDTE